MRDLKFRSYDVERKEMDYYWLDQYDTYYHNNFGNIMQFTWLKDKNWKEIYEGDLLKFNKEESIISIKRDNTWANWQFDVHNGFDDWVWRWNWDFNLWISKGCEIIWNIYETPELLNTSTS